MQHPKISIIIAVLNQKQHLQKAIVSIINQDLTATELVFKINGSYNNEKIKFRHIPIKKDVLEADNINIYLNVEGQNYKQLVPKQKICIRLKFQL